MRFILKKYNKRAEAIERLDRDAAETHKKNIGKIVANRKDIDKLNTVLKQNNIVFQLAHVIGHTK